MKEHTEKPTDNPIWGEIAAAMKLQMRVAKGDIAVLLIERDGAVATILGGSEAQNDSRRMAASLRQFANRLEEMARHAENDDLDLTSEQSQCFIRDSESGQYEEQE